MDIQSLKFEGINSISNNTWHYRPLNKELIKQTKKQFDLDSLLLTILANRGIEVTNLKKFLDHSLRNNIPDPKVINDMEKAIKRIRKAVLNEEQIGIIGDYDVDGIVSASILYLSLIHI